VADRRAGNPGAEYLISIGRLSEAETLQRGKAEVALGRVLADLFQRWRNQLLSGAMAPLRKSSRGNRDLMQGGQQHMNTIGEVPRPPLVPSDVRIDQAVPQACWVAMSTLLRSGT
jgi:hypothetical protein